MFKIEQQQTHDTGPCDCCGAMSRCVSGLVFRRGDAYAGYQVHWTLGQVPKHGASFYLILGYWGEDTAAVDRYAVAVRYRADSDAAGFMVVDADVTPIASSPLVGMALRRREVVDTPLAREVYDLVDFIWLHDERISGIANANAA